MKFHVMIKGITNVIKWNTIEKCQYQEAVDKAIEVWQYNGGDEIAVINVYEFQEGDYEHQYRWANENIYSERLELYYNSSLQEVK